jgi:hypothetical protein
MSTHRQASPALAALPEESIWKRYSSRMELPLSFGVALLLHLAVAMVAGLAGALVFSFEVQATPMPKVETVVLCGGSGWGDGIGDPNGPCVLVDPFYLTKPGYDPPVATENQGDTEAQEKRGGSAGQDDVINRAERKPGFTVGRGWRDGSGRGEASGPDSSKPELDGRYLRQSRWKIILPREDPEAFVKKLNDLKVLLVIPTAADGSYNDRYLLCDDLAKRPVVFKPVDAEEINAYNRLWFMSDCPIDATCVATALNLPKRPRWIAIFIPPDLEQALARAEFTHKKISEDELNQRGWITHFDVDRRGEAWVVRVRYVGTGPSPLGDVKFGPGLQRGGPDSRP